MKRLATALLLSCSTAWADSPIRPDSHAPIGVMGDHTHQTGEWMFSYRYMTMSMQGNRVGDDRISPETIVTTVPNRLAGQPMQPPTLRVVPVEMTMDMHMLGGMYASTDQLTWMVMAQYLDKEMDHVTFAGGMGDTRLGEFTTRASGLGDTSVSALYQFHRSDSDRLSATTHATLGLSLPTGSIDESDDVLTPMNTRPTLRLPYPMQLGSGTYDAIVGLTHQRLYANWSLGGQWQSVIRMSDNDENYSHGDRHQLSAWGSRLLTSSTSLSFRLTATDVGRIDGDDALIRAPIQTANPDFQGGESITASIGLAFAGQDSWSGHRLAIEAGFPVHQDLNGPQLETDWTVTVGYQFSPH